MRLNVEKLKFMHFGKLNPKEVYCMTYSASNENYIEETNLGRDLGVIVGCDLKWREHADGMVGKANRKLGMLKKTFESREPGLWKDLYVSPVMPDLEYAVQAWNPHLQEEIDKIERLKRRASRITVLRNLNMKSD